MESPEFPSSEREERFTEVLTEYLEALEAGQPDDRAALLTRFPDLADDLRAFFAREDQVQELATPLRHATSVSTSFAGAPRGAAEATFPKVPVEQFRIVREVGRGGMGVVYEAVELSLGRRVALKVLRPQNQSDPRALQRFLREARIVARLHHTNIVPIFQVGEHGGLHYFAMEFIDGRGLDRVLHARRDGPTRSLFGEMTPPLTDEHAAPTVQAVGPDSATVLQETKEGKDGSVSCNADHYREAARIGIQVAEALAHAHEHGVLHRDIKPSNLLLDRAGTIWVTDFGLAKEGQEDLTDSGEVVGTLRYLAPERFSGQVDARGDVYSLGATLYELLTLQPVYEESDRAKLMARVLHDEPTRPRQIDVRIPRDLETIVLKALAKEPARRYPTARALADDLRRFLDDAPIQARRASLFERGWRWCRRNPAIAVASTAAVAALVVGLGVALWQWQRAEENARRAQANATQAKKDFELAFQAIDQMVAPVGDDYLMQLPRRDKAPLARLQDAVLVYRNFLQGKEAYPKARVALARAYYWVGVLKEETNDLDEALQEFDQALALVKDRPHTDPDAVECRRLAAAISTHRAYAQRLQRPADAEADFRHALARWDALSAEDSAPSAINVGRAFTLLHLGNLLRSASRLDEAEPVLRQSVALAEEVPADQRYRSRLLVLGLCDLAQVLKENGSITESERVHQRASELLERAARLSPKTFTEFELATALRSLAQLTKAKGTEGEGLYRVMLADNLNDFGVLLRESRPREAAAALERSISLWKDLVAKFPEVPRYHVGLGGALHNLAHQRETQGNLAEARPLYEEAIRRQEQVVKTNHKQANTLEFLSNHRSALAKLLRKLGEPREAEQTMLRQQALAQELAEKDGKSAVVRIFQARTCEDLAYQRRDSKQIAEAVTAFSDAAGHHRKLAADFPNNPHHASRLGAVLNDWAGILAKQRRWADMIPLVDEAIKVQEAAVRARPEEQTYQRFLYNHYSGRAAAALGLGDHAHVFAAVTSLRERFPDRFDNYRWGGAMALCIPLANKDSHLSQENRAKLVRQYADASMAYLRAAQQKQAKDLPQIHISPAFEPLRGRPDFQELLALVPKPAKSAK